MFFDHKNKLYEVEINSDVSFQPIEIEAYKNVFTKIAKKENGMDIKIENATILRGMPIVSLIAIDVEKKRGKRERKEKKTPIAVS